MRFIGEFNQSSAAISLAVADMTAELNAKRRTMFERLAAILHDDDLADEIEDEVKPLLAEIEMLNYRIGSAQERILPIEDLGI